MKKLVFGVGVNDVGDTLLNGKPSKWYGCWTSMIRRCYFKSALKRNPTYIGCTVCEDWKTASNFQSWFVINYSEGCDLDKDILVDGNKIYSPETCRFVPSPINKLFLDCRCAKGEYPTGVSYHKCTTKYLTKISVYGKRKHLGIFLTPELAHQAYLIAKKSHCKEVADKYLADGSITQEIYDAILRKADNLK